MRLLRLILRLQMKLLIVILAALHSAEQYSGMPSLQQTKTTFTRGLLFEKVHKKVVTLYVEHITLVYLL